MNFVKPIITMTLCSLLFMSCKEKTEEDTTTVAQPNEEQIIEDDRTSEATPVALLEKGVEFKLNPAIFDSGIDAKPQSYRVA